MDLTAIIIVAIVAWTIVSIIKAAIDKSTNKSSSKDVKAYETEIASLKERVSVLEKIVTDDKYDLKKQFEALEKDKVA